MLNGQVYGNLYQVAGSAGHPERIVKSQLEKQYNQQTYSPQKQVKQIEDDGSPGNFQDQFENMPENLGCEPTLENNGTGQMFSGGNPLDQPVAIETNQYSISLKEGGSL